MDIQFREKWKWQWSPKPAYGPYGVITITLDHSEVPAAKFFNSVGEKVAAYYANVTLIGGAIKRAIEMYWGKLTPDFDDKDQGQGVVVVVSLPLVGVGLPYSTVTARRTDEKEWVVVGIGDFSRLGHASLLWRRRNETGEARIWTLDEAANLRRDHGLVPPDKGWHVVAVGDFNGDGKDEIAWRRTNGTGEVRLWVLDEDGNLVKDAALPVPAPGWRVVGAAKLAGGNRDALLWRRQDDSGEARVWRMNAECKVEGDTGLPQPAKGWRIVGIGDFNGDGIDDIAWRRTNDTGEVHIWLLDGTINIKMDKALPEPAQGWKVVGVGDFSGSKRASLLWRRQNDCGEARVWLLDQSCALQRDVVLPSPDAGWKIIGVGDFNGDGISDIAWRRSDESGEVRIWFLDSSTQLGQDLGVFPVASGSTTLPVEGKKPGPGGATPPIGHQVC